MLAPNLALDAPLAAAAVDITAIDPSMSGLLAVARIASTLREELSLIAEVVMPRFNMGERLTRAEEAEIRRRSEISSELTRLLEMTIEVTGPTEAMRRAVIELRRWDDSGELQKLSEIANGSSPETAEDSGVLRPQIVFIPWADRIAELRAAIMDATVKQVVARESTRERRFDFGLAGFGLVAIAILEAVFMLRRRVVVPLARLGVAIRRIAAGDRSVKLTICVRHSRDRRNGDRGRNLCARRL